MKTTTTCLIAALLTASATMMASDKFDLTKIDLTKLPPPAQQKGLTCSKDIRPLLETACTRCHGEQRPRADLRLDSLEAVLKGGKDGQIVVVGNSKDSRLVIAAAQIDDETAMPPKRRPGLGGPGGPGNPGGSAESGRPVGPGGLDAPPPGENDGSRPPRPGGPNPGGPDAGGGPRRGPGGPGGFGPPSKPLTAEQVGLIRAWIDQGAK